jgi:hypothetical protein
MSRQDRARWDLGTTLDSPAAFIPAESPPLVNTAIFFCLLGFGRGFSFEVLGSKGSLTPSRSLVGTLISLKLEGETGSMRFLMF